MDCETHLTHACERDERRVQSREGTPVSTKNDDTRDSAAPDTPRRLSPLVRLRSAELTTSEAKLAQVLADRYPEAALLSARGMAIAAGASPASVTRFAKKLGYRDYAGLQADLAVEMRARLSSPPKRLSVKGHGRRKSASTLLQEVISQDASNLQATVLMLDEQQLEAFVRRLVTSTRARTYVVGSKKGAVVARYFALQLAQLRAGVVLLTLSDHLADELLDLSPHDLLVVFEPRRATRALVRVVREARSVGMHVAAFTDEQPPAVLAESDFLFLTKVDAISVFDSYAAMFALCDATLAALVQRSPKLVRARADRLERLNEALDSWYDSKGRKHTSGKNDDDLRAG